MTTYFDYLFMLYVIPIMIGLVTFFLTLAITFDGDNYNYKKSFYISIPVTFISLLLVGKFAYDPQMYENSYNKMLKERPKCLTEQNKDSMGCLDQYLDWKKDSVKITNRYLEEKAKLEKELENIGK